jgi:hypothetical protein
MSTTIIRRAVVIASFGAALVAARPFAHAGCSSTATPTGYTCWVVKTGDIMPSQTYDDGNNDNNYVYVPDNPAPGHKMVLFLAGTGGGAGDYHDFLAEAAHEGYYVIGLAYRNQIHSPDMCGYWAACPGKLYQQQVDGYDNGFFAHDAAAGQVPEYNSITYRFGEVLAWAIANHGGAVDWNVFWNYGNAYSPGPGYWYNGTPAWGHIVVAGHSQGGETATWITKNKNVIAGLAFEAPYATRDDDHSGDDGADTTADGPPHHMKQVGGVWTDVTSWYTPWATSGGTVCDTCFADFLDPSSWPNGQIDRLFITLDSHDGGYDPATSWLGHWMKGAGVHLGKNETQHLNACPSQLSTRFNTTDYVSTCGGHHATIQDGCTPPWIKCYWDLMLDRALTL